MKYIFNDIETELLPNGVKLILFDTVSGCSAELEVSVHLLSEWYLREFSTVRLSIKGWKEYEISLKDWYEEYVKYDTTKRKAWDIWERAKIEKLTLTTTYE